MKNIFCIMTIFAMTQGGFAQTDKQIVDIDKARQEIKDNISTYQSKIENYIDSTSYRTHYLQDSKLKLLTVKHRGNSVDRYVEWFFSNGQLIYSEQIWTDLSLKKIIDNQKFYLANGQLISWIKSDGSLVDNTSIEFKAVEKGLFDLVSLWTNKK